jgi:hypothetical protein
VPRFPEQRQQGPPRRLVTRTALDDYGAGRLQEGELKSDLNTYFGQASEYAQIRDRAAPGASAASAWSFGRRRGCGIGANEPMLGSAKQARVGGPDPKMLGTLHP